MAIVQNIASEDGDIIVIKTDVPVVGIVALTTFADTTENESGSIYFEKTFRYSINAGLTYTDWIELTTVNVQNIVIERVNYFIIEYRYKRVGNGTPDVAFDNLTLSGTINPLEYPVYHSMIFNDYFPPNEVGVLDWAINVLEKLYKRGIIASYVVRNKGTDDQDFVAYFFTITHFFAILVYYARGFENISTDPDLMREFVIGRGVYMTDNPDIEELYYIYSNYISEIQKRGTKQIYRRTKPSFDIDAGTVYEDDPIVTNLIDMTIDGELLRILNIGIVDEFIFAYTLRGDLGWCIGQSSPLYTGADNIINLIKGYEYTPEVNNLTKYPLLNPNYINIIDETMEIDPAGIGTGIDIGIGVEAFDITKAILIDSSLDYEISFKITWAGDIESLTFGVSLFDIDGNQVNATQITDETISNLFFDSQSLNMIGEEYWVRGVVHAYTAELLPGDVLTIGFGSGLQMPSTAVYLIPTILVRLANLTSAANIRDIKIRPASLWFSRGTLSARNFIIGYLKSNSAAYSEDQIEKILNEKLIPYNTYPLVRFAPFNFGTYYGGPIGNELI